MVLPRPPEFCQCAALRLTKTLSVRTIRSIILITVPFPRPEGSECKLCPRHWVLHMDKCYWVSKENKYWRLSRDDCSQRGSDLLVIQDREELVKNVPLLFFQQQTFESKIFIHNFSRILQCSVLSDPVSISQEFAQNLTGNQNPVWIGLSITSSGRMWTWVDGSPLNQML
uniref:C-type lectin domain-containing protein n=1 Tax=Gopherus evgoodei TaxID=1825980 RepID=A0A8C4W6Q1_9SAUR